LGQIAFEYPITILGHPHNVILAVPDDMLTEKRLMAFLSIQVVAGTTPESGLP
jgi:hypothetical protein